MKNEKSEKQTGSDFTFLYWDDMVDIPQRNENSDEHYFDYFNDHPNSAQIWDDEEQQDIE
jgi:hypothetical protein